MFSCNSLYIFVSVTVDGLISLAVGAVSSSKNMGFDENEEGGEKSTRQTMPANQEANHDEGERISRQMSETSTYTTEEEDDEGSKLELGPQYTLKEQLEKDKVCFSRNYIFQKRKKDGNYILLFKFLFLSLSLPFLGLILSFQDDESLRRWKEQLLGSVDLNNVGGISFSGTKLYDIV